MTLDMGTCTSKHWHWDGVRRSHSITCQPPFSLAGVSSDLATISRCSAIDCFICTPCKQLVKTVTKKNLNNKDTHSLLLLTLTLLWLHCIHTNNTDTLVPFWSYYYLYILLQDCTNWHHPCETLLKGRIGKSPINAPRLTWKQWWVVCHVVQYKNVCQFLVSLLPGSTPCYCLAGLSC